MIDLDYATRSREPGRDPEGPPAPRRCRSRQISLPSPAEPAKRRLRPLWWLELLLIGGGYGLYHLAQIHAPAEAAIRHGRDVLAAEHWAHLDIELWLNRLTSPRAWLAIPADYYYEVLHFGVTISVLLWLWWRHPGWYRRARRVLIAGSLMALVVFWVYPTAPPRLLPGSGFVDTSVTYHTLFSLESGKAAKAADLFASMPSLHIGWALWCAWALAGASRNKAFRTWVYAYPIVTSVVVMATANHFLFDLVGGALVMVLGAAAGLWLPDRWHRNRVAERPGAVVALPVRAAAPVAARGRVWAFRVAVVAGPAALAAAVAYQHRFVTGALKAAAHADPVWLALAVIAEVLSMSAFSRLHRRTLRMTGIRVRQRTALAINYASNAISATVPLVGTAAGAANTWRQYHRRGASAPAVTWALGATGVASAASFTILMAIGAVTSGNPAAMGAGAGVTATALALAAVLLAATHLPALQARLEKACAAGLTISYRVLRRREGHDPAGTAARFVGQLGSYRPAVKDVVVAVGAAVANWALDVACLALSIRAVGGHVPSSDIIVIWAAASAAASLTLTPAGLGIVEPVLAASLAIAGMPHSTAIAATVLYRLVSFLAVAATGWTIQLLLGRVRPAPVATVTALDSPARAA